MKKSGRFFQRPKRKFYFINFRIEAPTLRIIDSQGKQLGILSKQEALIKAQQLDEDLVLIAPRANPPVAKIIDFKKFLYQEKKKAQISKKGVKKSATKDISLSLFICPADFERLVNKGIGFIKAGNQLRLNLLLKGREIIKKDMAFSLLTKYISKLGEVNISKQPRQEGRVVRAVISKKK